MIHHQFKRTLRNMTVLASLCITAATPLTSYGQTYTVDINKTQIMHLPAPAAAIVVGNTAIADVSVHSPNLLFVVGRGYGVTNVIVLNDLGQTIFETDIQVKNSHSNTGKRVMLVGRGWQSYECSPFCQPAPVLSDDPGFVAQFRGRNQPINNTSSPVAPASFPAISSNPDVFDSALLQSSAPVIEPFNPRLQQTPTLTTPRAQR